MARQRSKASSKKCKFVLLTIGGLAISIIGMLVYLYWPRSLPPKPLLFTLIAHRGVHQTFPFGNVKNDTCTATIIYPPTHNFLENTISSIREAFKYGADMVEIDIHPTTDNQLAVFHDWTIDCRTNGRGITHDQNMETLKNLDIGYGYTADGGKTYPFRGKGVGLMPTFEEVLQEFPEKKLAVDQKDKFEKTVQIVVESLKKRPKLQRENIYFFSEDEQYWLLKKEIPEVQKILPSRDEEKDCIPQYLGMLFSSRISERCNKYAFAIPARYLKYVPGWPSLFLSKAQQVKLKVYVVDVDTREDLGKIKDLPIDGIVTNRIEIIGPLMKKVN